MHPDYCYFLTSSTNWNVAANTAIMHLATFIFLYPPMLHRELLNLMEGNLSLRRYIETSLLVIFTDLLLFIDTRAKLIDKLIARD